MKQLLSKEKTLVIIFEGTNRVVRKLKRRKVVTENEPGRIFLVNADRECVFQLPGSSSQRGYKTRYFGREKNQDYSLLLVKPFSFSLGI